MLMLAMRNDYTPIALQFLAFFCRKVKKIENLPNFAKFENSKIETPNSKFLVNKILQFLYTILQQ